VRQEPTLWVAQEPTLWVAQEPTLWVAQEPTLWVALDSAPTMSEMFMCRGRFHIVPNIADIAHITKNGQKESKASLTFSGGSI